MTARVPTSWIRREPDQSFRSLWYNMPFSCQSTSPPPLILLTAWTANSTVDLEVDRKPKHPFEYSLYSWFSLVLRLAPYFLSLLDDRLGFTYRKVYSSMSILLLLRITSDLICCSFAKYFGSGVIVSWLFGFMESCFTICSRSRPLSYIFFLRVLMNYRVTASRQHGKNT